MLQNIERFTKKPQFHEELADLFLELFKGKQTLLAFHHGVLITTEREQC